MSYDPAAYPRAAVTVDLVVLTVRADALHVLLVRRGEDAVARPGRAARRLRPTRRGSARPRPSVSFAEETGLSEVPGHLEQLGSYGDPARDPRMRVVSVAYLALAPDLPDPVPVGDAAGAPGSRWHGLTPLRSRSTMRRILADGVERARAKLEYTALATAFCPPEFTVAQLRRVYEIVWGVELDPRNFHRKVTGTPGLLVDTGRTRQEGRRPAAAVYRSGPAQVLHPPLTREA